MRSGALVLVALGIMAAGCAANGSATNDVARAQGRLLEAEAMGARNDVNAWMYITQADRELTLAKERVAMHDVAGARSEASRAEADARVAKEVAREMAERRAVRKTMDDVSVLQDRLGPATTVTERSAAAAEVTR